MIDSTSAKRRRKRSSGRGAFPLFKHAGGRWCKKILGRHHYSGKTDRDSDGQAALARYVDQNDDLYAGRIPGRIPRHNP